MTHDIRMIIERFKESKAEYLEFRLGQREYLELEKRSFALDPVIIQQREIQDGSKNKGSPGGGVSFPVISENVGVFKNKSKKLIKGAMLQEGDTLGEVEAMGITHTILAPRSGILLEDFVQNGDIVEYAQELLRIGEES